MSILFRKKKIYYLAGTAAVVALCLMAPYRAVGSTIYSVFGTICKLPATERGGGTVRDVFTIGLSSSWFYLLMPVISAVPIASYLSDERKSKFHLYEKMREGTFRYLCSRILWALVGSTAILLAGLGAYVLVLSRYFSLCPEGMAGAGNALWELIQCFGAKFGYLFLYSFAFSLLTSFLVLVYNDMYFDLSIALVLNYLFRQWFMKDNIFYPLALIALLSLMYCIRWKMGKRNMGVL